MVDEIGFVPLHKEAAELLFQVISNCYERRSLIITSNLEFSQWNTVFGDNRLAAALIDRFIHHSHIGIFSGESYRLAQSMNRQWPGIQWGGQNGQQLRVSGLLLQMPARQFFQQGAGPPAR